MKKGTDCIKYAIEKAIEGGYVNYSLEPYDEWWQRRLLWLDPDFWIALGKSLGWGVRNNSALDRYNKDKWLREWHNFIDHLALRKEPAEFFRDILTK